MRPVSCSSRDGLSLGERYRYYRDLFNLHRQGAALTDAASVPEEFNDLDRYARLYCGQSLTGLRALEIGFGARPYRLAYLISRGVDTVGVDLDQPVLKGSLSEAMQIARRNGLLRAAKSLARYWIFEHQAAGAKDSALSLVPTLDPKRLIVGNAGVAGLWDRIGMRDIIYSFRVFEHMDPVSLKSVLDLMHRHIQSNGFCYIVVTVYTGLIGGHLPEWYPEGVHVPAKRSEPWEHLRRQRNPADTYLNRLTRRDYMELFSTRFAVTNDEPLFPELGREFLTDQVREELSAWDEYELLSNDVLFVLRPLNS